MNPPPPRTAVVAGSSRGIGLAVARALLEQGADVVLNGRDPDVLAATASGLGEPARVRTVAGPADDPEVADAMIATAVDSFGGVDALICCAGTAEPPGSSILDITSSQWQELIASHLTSAFELCRAGAPVLVARGGGAIVLTGSHAFTGTYGGTGYPAGKGGVLGLTRALAAELAEHGIRVNAVLPGARTRLSTGADYEAAIERLHGRGLLGDLMRAGSLDPAPPEHVAALYAYLVSDLAVGITGQVLVGSGGYLGRFPAPAEELLAYRDHADRPPYTPEEIDGHVR